MRIKRARYLPLFFLVALLGGCDHNVVGPAKIPKDLVLMTGQSVGRSTPSIPVTPDALRTSQALRGR